MKVSVLASGSKGNAIYVAGREVRVLIDAGISGQQLVQRLEGIGVGPETLDGLVVTHEHSDHVKGIGVLARRFDLPIYANASTVQSMDRVLRGREEVHLIEKGSPFQIGDALFTPFALPHDAADPISFSINDGRRRVAIATDLGFASHLVREHIKGADLLILETNHDETLLKQGSYPWPIKQRILSQVGHLSNHTAGQVAAEVVPAGTRLILLAHLSEENNRPGLAREAVAARLEQQGYNQIPLLIACQDRATEVIDLNIL